MRTNSIGFVCGLIFGIGLSVSGMVDPVRVLGFLDVTGVWDPTLAFVMAGALLVTAVGYSWVLKRPAPLAASRFELPTRTDVDVSLIAGATLFGAGWGLAGYCPGPALAAVTLGGTPTWVFLVGMLSGMGLVRALAGRVAPGKRLAS